MFLHNMATPGSGYVPVQGTRGSLLLGQYRGILSRHEDCRVARTIRGFWWTAALLVSGLFPQAGLAQGGHAHADSAAVVLGAHAVAMSTVVSPALDGRTFAEAYFAQPALAAHAIAWNRRLEFTAMVTWRVSLSSAAN